MSKKLTKLTVSFAAAAAIAGTLASSESHAKKKDFEKCYGIVKAGKNDCGSKDGAHSCAGQATKNADPNEWVLVPKGLCDKIHGGIKG